MGPEVTMVGDFLNMPYLAHVVTDTRDRLGWLIAFVAQVQASGDPQAIGLGVDEDGALCIDADGIDRFFTASGGHVWLVQPDGAPQVEPGPPLEYPSVRITTLGSDGEIDLKTMRITRPAFSGTASVRAGQLLNVPVNPTGA